MTIDLSNDEVTLLRQVLDRELDALTRELVRTDAPALQHALNADVERLARLRNRIEVVTTHRVAPPSSAQR